MNLLHELAPGPDVPDAVYVVVEVPKGSQNKYEYDKELEGVPTEVLGWERASLAHKQIVYAADLYQQLLDSTASEP